MAKKISKEVEASAVSETKETKDFCLIKTGVTLLDLACSDNSEGGFQSGTIVNFVGDSSSGKTFTVLTCLAEACCDPQLDEYELVYDDAESRNNFNFEKLFGEDVASRIVSPFGKDKDGDPINSELIEDFQDAVFSRLEAGRPFIYVLDSMDALDAEPDVKKFKEVMKQRYKAREKQESTAIAGTYGMSKAKSNSEILRRIKGMLRKTRSLLIIISQTRENVGIGFAEKTRSGGKALKFYCTHEIWAAVVGSLTKSVNDKPIKIGVRCRTKIKKNSLTGKEREVDFDIYYDYGVDDVGSMVDFLLETKFWTKVKQTITSDFGDATKVKLVSIIEEDMDKITKLRKLCQRAWLQKERALRLGRKRRFERS